MSTEEKKAFDPTVSFMFFGSWCKTIEEIKIQFGDAAAYTMFEAIAEYSMYSMDPDFSSFPVLRILWPTIEKEVDMSIGNRKRYFSKDVINEKYQAIIKAVIENPNASLRKIADMTGTDKNMVDRVRKKYSTEITDGISHSTRNSLCTSIDPLGAGIACDNDSAYNSNRDSDCKGQDKTGQEPTIADSFSYLEKAEEHNIIDIPREYYLTGEENLQSDEEEDFTYDDMVENLMNERRMTREEAIAFLDGLSDDLPF